MVVVVVVMVWVDQLFDAKILLRHGDNATFRMQLHPSMSVGGVFDDAQ